MNRRETMLALAAFAAAAGPRASLAQPLGKVWRVGFLSPTSASHNTQNSEAFLKGMRALGYVEGRNLVVEWRYADNKLERLPVLAADLVELKVDVIVATPSFAIAAAQKATTTIPIVMASAGDPVGNGFVQSLARPGGNITGLSTMGGDIGGKLLDLLRSVVPRLSRVAVLTATTTSGGRLQSVQTAAQRAGIKAVVAEASTVQEIGDAFARLAQQKVDAVIVTSPTTFALQQRHIAELALKYRMPSMFQDRANVEAGGLMSYGQKTSDFYLRAATYVDKILRGAHPGDLPVEQPVTLEFVVNLKTAKALGLTIPKTILLRADEVIE